METGPILALFDRQMRRDASDADACAPAGNGTASFWPAVAERARIARERGHRWLVVDALPASRPILERLGFERLTSTTPYVLLTDS